MVRTLLVLVCVLVAIQLATCEEARSSTRRVRSRLARARAAFVELADQDTASSKAKTQAASKTKQKTASHAEVATKDLSTQQAEAHARSKLVPQDLGADLISQEESDAALKSFHSFLAENPEAEHINLGASLDKQPAKPASLAHVQYPNGLTEEEIAKQKAENSGEGSDPFDSPKGGKRHKYHHNINITSTDLTITKPVRKNILHMSKKGQEDFLLACNLLKAEAHLPPFGHNHSKDDNGTRWSTWDWLSYKHFLISLAHPSIANGALFLPWHRQWLMLYEDNMRRVLEDDDFTLPYWDWSNRYEAMKIFTDKLIGGNGTGAHNAVTNGAFSHWNQKVNVQANLVVGPINRLFGVSHQRKKLSSFGQNITYWSYGSDDDDLPGNKLTPEQKQAGTFPSSCDVLKTLGMRKYYTGNDQCMPSVTFGLWYLHRIVHVMIGGDMNLVAANDPVLLLHHNFLDKLWMMWQKSRREETANNRYGFPEGAITDNLRWVGGTAGEMLKWEEMPYHYQWDDTIDNMFYKYKYKGMGYETMCWTWEKQINGADGGRNMTSLCHVYQ